MKETKIATSTLVGAVFAAIAASLCCVVPLVLLLLGIGGAWVSTFTKLEFLRPVAVTITLLFLGFTFWKLYMTPRTCAIDQPCAKPSTLKLQRIIFWVVTFVVLLLLSFPWYAPLFY